jgi:hypothetical protein
MTWVTVSAETARDWRPRLRTFLVAAALLGTLLLASAPYLWAYQRRPAGSVFYAVPPINYGDATQYLGLTRTAAEGHLLVGNPFTTEPHTPRLFLPQVQLEGLLCRTFGWSPLAAFQASRVLAGGLLLGAGWWFGTLLLRRWRQRWLFLGLLCLSAGAGWLLERADINLLNGDLLQPEGNTLFTLGNLPNLNLAQSLLTGLFATLLALERNGRRRWLALTAACAFVLAWTHPFDFVTLALGLGSYALVRWVSRGKAPRASLLHAAALVVGALPAALYLGWLVATDAFYRSLASDTIQVQPFAYYAAAHGILLLPAAVALAHPLLRRRYALALCWVACVFLFLLLPLGLGGKQARLIGGVHVPLALLAAVGVEWAARRLAGRRQRAEGRRQKVGLAGNVGRGVASRALVVGYLMVAATGGLGVIGRHFRHYAAGTPQPYVPATVRQVLEHIERAGDRSQVTLGGDFTGGWAPVFADTRSFHGHWHMTLNAEEKGRERAWFYLVAADPLEKARWLQARGITWVILLPAEWGRPVASLEDVPGLQRVETAPDVWLYRFSAG